MDLQSRAEQLPPYQIVESDEFSKQFSVLVRDIRLRDELQREFYSELPAKPEKFPKVPGTKLHVITIVCNPPLSVFFTIKERIITLLEIHPL